MNTPSITHDTDTQRFETIIDGITAYLSYDVIDEHTLDYNHTIVPSALGGRGVGSALAKVALAYADESGSKIIPSCSFIAAYIRKNPQYAPLLA